MLKVLILSPMTECLTMLPRGAFYFLGSRSPAIGCVFPNHSSRFKVGEDVKFETASMALLAYEFGKPKGAA